MAGRDFLITPWPDKLFTAIEEFRDRVLEIIEEKLSFISKYKGSLETSFAVLISFFHRELLIKKSFLLKVEEAIMRQI